MCPQGRWRFESPPAVLRDFAAVNLDTFAERFGVDEGLVEWHAWQLGLRVVRRAGSTWIRLRASSRQEAEEARC
jgi:hypothetical protein